MILIIDNTKRILRTKLRLGYLSKGIPCALSDLEHAADYMPCSLIQVTEKYLYNDALLLAKMYGGIPVCVDEHNMSLGIIGGSPHIAPLDNGVRFCSKKLYLTKTERLIVNMLLMFGGSVSAELAAQYCMLAPSVSAVRAHVCNINSKAKRLTGVRLIDCHRYEGYRLHEFDS